MGQLKYVCTGCFKSHWVFQVPLGVRLEVSLFIVLVLCSQIGWTVCVIKHGGKSRL